MNDENMAGLQDEEEWDIETAVRMRSPEGRPAVEAVGITTHDFALVTEAAERRDLSVSQFIREPAFDYARRELQGSS